MSLSAQCRVYIAASPDIYVGPLVEFPTWDEVTDYVRSVRVNRGRSSELDDFQAGTATVVLDNTDRRFDPDYDASPYVGCLNVRVQIKIEAVYSATTYPIFRGVVQAWNQEWPGKGKDATCVVQCADLFSILGTWDLPDSAYEPTIRPLAPTLWWGMGDDGPTAAPESGNGYFLSYSADRVKADALEHAGQGASRLEMYTGIRNLAEATFPTALASSDSTTIAAILQTDVASNVGVVVLRDSSSNTVSFQVAGGVIAANCTQNSPLVNRQPTGNAADGLHHIAVTRSGATVKLYVDGVEAATTGTFGTGSYALTSIQVNATKTGTIDEVAIWESTALTAAQVIDLSEAAFGWVNDTASDRITRLLDLLGVPSGLYSIGTASSTVGRHTGGQDALSALLECVRADQGRLFVNRSGVVTFHPKTTDMGVSSAATFSDNTGTANSVKYGGFGFELNDRLIYNKVTVTGTDGVSFTAENTTSQATYSVRSLGIDTALPTVEACRDVAQAYVARYADPAQRGKSWTVYPERTLNGSTTLGYATVLGRELGDIVTVVRTPPVGTAISKTVQVTSIEHAIDIPKGQWDVTFTGAPAYTTASFRWGTSNWGGSDGWS